MAFQVGMKSAQSDKFGKAVAATKLGRHFPPRRQPSKDDALHSQLLHQMGDKK